MSITPEARAAWKRQNDRVSNRREGEYGPYTNQDWQDASLIWTELARLTTDLAALKVWQAKARLEYRQLVAEHKDVLDCAAKDDPDATDGINGWAMRVQAERDKLRSALAAARLRRDRWKHQFSLLGGRAESAGAVTKTDVPTFGGDMSPESRLLTWTEYQELCWQQEDKLESALALLLLMCAP
jgi:hypothetical protein